MCLLSLAIAADSGARSPTEPPSPYSFRPGALLHPLGVLRPVDTHLEVQIDVRILRQAREVLVEQASYIARIKKSLGSLGLINASP